MLNYEYYGGVLYRLVVQSNQSQSLERLELLHYTSYRNVSILWSCSNLHEDVMEKINLLSFREDEAGVLIRIFLYFISASLAQKAKLNCLTPVP